MCRIIDRPMLVLGLLLALHLVAGCGDPVDQANEAAGRAEQYRDVRQLYRAVRAVQLPQLVAFEVDDEFSGVPGATSGTIFYRSRPTVQAMVGQVRNLEVYLDEYRKVLRQQWDMGMGSLMDRNWVLRGPNWVLMTDDFERLALVQEELGGRISELSAY